MTLLLQPCSQYYKAVLSLVKIFKKGQNICCKRNISYVNQISSYSFRPWIVSSLEYFLHLYVLWPLALYTVTFAFPNSKKNSFRGSYMRKYARYVPFTFAEQQKAMRAKTIMVWILILEIRNWHDHTLKAISFHKNNHKCFGNRNLEAILGSKLIHSRVIFRFIC